MSLFPSTISVFSLYGECVVRSFLPDGVFLPCDHGLDFLHQLIMYGQTYSKSMDQPGKVASPARGQLNREKNISLYAFVPENLVSQDGFGSPVPRQPAHLHTQAESGAYLRDFSRV